MVKWSAPNDLHHSQFTISPFTTGLSRRGSEEPERIRWRGCPAGEGQQIMNLRFNKSFLHRFSAPPFEKCARIKVERLRGPPPKGLAKKFRVCGVCLRKRAALQRSSASPAGRKGEAFIERRTLARWPADTKSIVPPGRRMPPESTRVSNAVSNIPALFRKTVPKARL
jgi:hypothetical protein